MVLAVLAIILLGVASGFAMDIVKRSAAGQLHYPWIVHLHALTFVGWLALLTTQVTLARTGNLALHRRLGRAGMLMVPAMLLVGPGMAIEVLASAPQVSDRKLAFLATSLGSVLVFAVVVTAALILRRDGAAHKRLMLLATIDISAAGFSRLNLFSDTIPSWFGAGYGAHYLRIYGISFVLVAAIGLYDLATRGRLHPAYVAAAAGIFGVQALEVWLFFQPFWLGWMKALTGH